MSDTYRLFGRNRIRREAAEEKAGPAPGLSHADDFEIKIIRSARRKKTVGARMVNWYTLEIRAPVAIPDAELERIIQKLAARMRKQRDRLRNFASDEGLERRAQTLNKRLFGSKLRWRSIRFATNQNSRFGSCSPKRGNIRISHRLAGVPPFVLNYVIVHELAHLLEANHSKAFWELVYRYEKTERARGYLMAMQMEGDVVEADD